MHVHLRPFTALVAAWDDPMIRALRVRLDPELGLGSLSGQFPSMSWDPASEHLLVRLVDGGEDGRTLALILLAPGLDRAARGLARAWRADGDEVAAAIASEAWIRLARRGPGVWRRVVSGSRDVVRGQLLTAARRAVLSVDANRCLPPVDSSDDYAPGAAWPAPWSELIRSVA